MKRILHLIAQKPAFTGSGIYLQEIIRAAKKKNYPQALVGGISKYDNIADFNLPTSLKIHPIRFETEDLPFPVVGMSDVMPYSSTKYSELTSPMYSQWKACFRKTIESVITNFKPDIIIAHHLWLLSALIKRIAPKIPLICISHGTELRQLELAPQFADTVITGCRKVERIVALNKFQAQQIASIYNIPKESIVTAGVGFNPDIFYPPPTKDKNPITKIIFTGKLSYAKGVKSLLQACELLYIEDRNFELILVGSGDGKEKEDISARTKKSSFKISTLGTINQQELSLLFRQGDIFILPSFYEGLPLVIIEALASGLRVVVSDLPGLKPYLGEEINNSGLISYVPLPNLINVDQAAPEDLPAFESQLKDSLLAQINRLHSDNCKPSVNIKPAIDKLTWASLFEKIESYF